MKKLLKIAILTIIGFSIMSGISNAQQAHVVSTTLFQKGDAAAYGGTSIGFFLKPSTFPGVGSNLYLYSVSIISLNTSANTVSVYVNATTYAQATVQAQNQLIGSVTHANNTTCIVGKHEGAGNGAVVDVLARAGVAYIGERTATFDFTTPDGKPTKVTAIGFKPTNAAAASGIWFTAVITYLRD